MKQNKSTSRWQSLRLPCVLAASLASLTASYADTYSDVIKADGPTAYYRMEDAAGATTITDEMGNNPGEWTYDTDDSGNSVYPQLAFPGLDSNSALFHPYTDASGTAHLAYGQVPYNADLNPSSAYTVELWARPRSSPPAGTFTSPLTSFGNWSDVSGWIIYQSESGWIWILKGGPVWMGGTPSTPLEWHHLVATYDGKTVIFYVDGVLQAQQDVANYLGNSGSPMYIGVYGPDGHFFDGSVDEIALYDKPLSQERISAHYTAGLSSVRAMDTAPVIVSQPADTSTFLGHKATFNVVADGMTPLSYQWYKGSTLIPDATNVTYSITSSLAESGTTYKVVVTNPKGSATSTLATFTASTELQLLGSPVSISRYVGSKAAFYVEAGGAAPFSYQWYKGSTAIANATNSMLWLDKIATADDGSTYYAKVSNGYYTTNSEPATLTVIARPATVDVSSGYAKIVIADSPVAYWRLDETDGSTTVLDAAGSFDGTYDNADGAGVFTYQVPTGITNETDTALGVSQSARVVVPWAPELNAHGAFSVEAWIKPASLSVDSEDYRTAFASESTDSLPDNPTGWLMYQTPANHLTWVVYKGGWAADWLTASSVTLVAGEWYHLVMTSDGSNFNFYINGELQVSAIVDGYVPNRDGGVNFGWRTLKDYSSFDGTIDEVAFYSKELSAAKVKAHYTQTAAPTAPSKIAIARSGTSVTLTWTSGVLQECATVNGTYTDVASATSPYTVTATTGAKFYRLKGQ